MPGCRSNVLVVGLLLAASCAAFASDYVGYEKCGLCHSEIAGKQRQTAMANTWQGRVSEWLPEPFSVAAEDDSSYRVTKRGDHLTYLVDLPGSRKMELPVSVMVGGKRHGLGFLAPLNEVRGVPLARPVLIQARYAWSPERKKLLLAPGCPAAKPVSTEQALGLALSPSFEARCLSCHGEPDKLGTGKGGGVHCESCHGPGSAHLAGGAIVNPRKLSNEDSIEVCAQCHVGLTKFSDPGLDDLLIANQVEAIKRSECWLQSGKAFSCTACHDPHQDASSADDHAVKVCLSCHFFGNGRNALVHASTCPVNAVDKCVSCHMPSVEMGPLHLVDHLIRVHPEQPKQALSGGMKTQVKPVSEYLRVITTVSAKSAADAYNRLAAGESFYRVSREVSNAPSAAIGGYVGRKNLSELKPRVALEAERLSYGETSRPVESDGKWTILQRLPRDFRWDAEQLQKQAEELGAHGDAASAIQKSQEALMIYPQFVRAIRFIGVTFARSGNAKKAVEILNSAVKLYPGDANAKYDLASALNMLGGRQAEAVEMYKQAISLEPDFTAAYLELGRLLFVTGDVKGAMGVFREGLRIDPTSAELYGELARALERNGDTFDGAQARKLSVELGPVQ